MRKEYAWGSDVLTGLEKYERRASSKAKERKNISRWGSWALKSRVWGLKSQDLAIHASSVINWRCDVGANYCSPLSLSFLIWTRGLIIILTPQVRCEDLMGLSPLKPLTPTLTHFPCSINDRHLHYHQKDKVAGARKAKGGSGQSVQGRRTMWTRLDYPFGALEATKELEAGKCADCHCWRMPRSSKASNAFSPSTSPAPNPLLAWEEGAI